MSVSNFSDKLEDMIPRYPDLSKNDSQKVFYGLAEIHSLGAKNEVEKRVKPGEYYKHQRMIGRAMMYVDRHLIMDDPGTGKTCKITLSDEMLKGDTNLFRKYIYVTPASLRESTKNQIICKCTNNVYINDKAYTKDQVRKSNKKEFSTEYKMVTYDEMYKMIIHHDDHGKFIRGKTAKELNEEFGYCVFNLDEVNELITLKMITSINMQGDVVGWNESLINDVKMLKNIKTDYDLDSPHIIDVDRQYVQFWRLFHAIKNSKVIFASGTIVSNRSAEFFLICNILLPLARQFDVEYFANNVFTLNLAKYSNYLNGLISYVKASSVVARPRYIGTKLNKTYKVNYPMDETSDNPSIGIKEFKSQFVLRKIELFGYQSKQLFQRKDKLTSEQIDSTIAQMLCCVDNNGQTGTRANSNINFTNALGTYGLANTLMRQYSCSMLWEIVRVEYYAYEEARANGLSGPGVCFSYLNLTETVVPIMKTLFRYANFEIVEDFKFLTETGGDYCNHSNITVKNLTKRPRVVFLSGQSNTDEKTRAMVTQFISSKENVNGEYIQFVNGSGVMAVGVNIGNTNRFVRPLPEWNEAKDRQTRDRVFREDSHDSKREIIADKKAEETGVRPGLYDFDVFVDVYNYCTFARYFYVKRNDYRYFVNDVNSNKEAMATPFLINSQNVFEIDELGLLIDDMKLMHLIGFCESGKIGESFGNLTQMGYGTIGGSLCTEFAATGDILYEKINERLNLGITPELTNLGMANMDIVFSFSGVIFSAAQSEELILFMKSNALIYYNNCDFMQVGQVGVYESGIAHVIRYSDTTRNDRDGRDYHLVPLAMRYVSPSEDQYIKMEEKSFASKRITRYAKQFAIDCIAEEARNYNSKDVDGSVECDYGECKYTCSSNILSGKSEDAFMYEGGGEFWSNYEILYSELIIKECKDKIMSMLRMKTEVKISQIFDKLLPFCQREYFINMAIYSLIISRKRIANSFGATSYVVANRDTLFLSEEFPRSIKNTSDNIGMYNNKLILVKTDPDYRNYMDIDSPVIAQIESINLDPKTPNYDGQMTQIILSLILSFKMPYISVPKLIENSFGRIAYYKTIPDPSMRNPIYNIKPCDDYITGRIYSIRCFVVVDGGYTYYVHNQPETKPSNRQGEIKSLMNASDPFRIFGIENGKPTWRNATPDENKKFAADAKIDIQRRIKESITKVLHIPYSDGTFKEVTVESFYYLNYFNSTYRFASRTKQDGENIESLSSSSVKPMLEWMKNPNNYFLYVGDNSNMLITIENMIQNGKDTQWKSVLKQFFEKNDLIFKFSVEELDEKKKHR